MVMVRQADGDYGDMLMIYATQLLLITYSQSFTSNILQRSHFRCPPTGLAFSHKRDHWYSTATFKPFKPQLLKDVCDCDPLTPLAPVT